MIDHFNMFAAYNRWANARLFDAARALSPQQLHQDCGAYFKSMHGTLNHLLVGDTAWMGRFENVPYALTGPDMILAEDFASLWVARQEMDARIIGYVAQLDDPTLNAEFSYQTMINPQPVTQKLAPALAHLFNHQTHHRGQAHGILTQLTGDAPELDLIYYHRDTMNDKAD